MSKLKQIQKQFGKKWSESPSNDGEHIFNLNYNGYPTGITYNSSKDFSHTLEKRIINYTNRYDPKYFVVYKQPILFFNITRYKTLTKSELDQFSKKIISTYKTY